MLLRLAGPVAATSSLALATACSVGLPDNVDDYLSSRGKLVATVTDAGAAPMSALSAACTPSFDADAAVSIIEVWRPPVPLHQNVCSEEQLALVINCSFNDPLHATPACQRLFSASENVSCLKCAVSTRSDATWGALLHDAVSDPPYPNVEGCVAALAGDTSMNGCGAKMIAEQDCASYACRNCDPNRGGDYETCYRGAINGLCAASHQAASCASAFLDTCAPADAPTLRDLSLGVARVFCGK